MTASKEYFSENSSVNEQKKNLTGSSDVNNRFKSRNIQKFFMDI